MTIAILDPFSGISGDMTLGALIDVGLDPAWLEALPRALGLEGVRVRIRDVRRGEIACKKVDFDIPPQPHGRGIREIRDIVARSAAPARVRALTDEAFTAIATCEGAIHGMAPEDVHLHEVGAVDAILDVVGAIWGFEMLGVREFFCGPVVVGDGTVRAAHGVLPVPAPATLKLLEGIRIRPGPQGSGELVTPTGAALVRVLTRGAAPGDHVPVRSGFGAGTKDFPDRANALRIVLGEHAEVDRGHGVRRLLMLAADIDDMSPEYLAVTADRLRGSGALDVTLQAVVMKKGRAGTRIEILCDPGRGPGLERQLLTETTTIGVRRSAVERVALPRTTGVVQLFGRDVRVKCVTRPDGRRSVKAELDDVARVAEETGQPVSAILRAAEEAAERVSVDWV